MQLQPVLNLLQAGGPLLGGGGGPQAVLSWNPEAGQALPPEFVFSRPDTRYYRNGAGLWVSAGNDTPRLHNSIVGGGNQGYLAEESTTKLAIQRRDFTDVAWVKTNITPAKDATGIDGVANACSSLTATSANATVFQTVASGAANHTMGAFVARRTGTGTIEMSIDGGTTWVDITSSLSPNIDNEIRITQNLANPSIGFRIVTSGDAIEVDCCDVEATTFGSTPLVVDNTGTEFLFSDLMSSTILNGEVDFSIFADCTPPDKVSETFSTDNSIWAIGVDQRVTVLGSPPGTRLLHTNYGPGNYNINGGVPSDRFKVTTRYKSGDTKTFSIVGNNSSADVYTPNDDFFFGYNGTQFGAKFFRGVIHKVELYVPSLSDQDSESLIA